MQTMHSTITLLALLAIKANACCEIGNCEDQTIRSCVGQFDPVCESTIWDYQCATEARQRCLLQCGCPPAIQDEFTMLPEVDKSANNLTDYPTVDILFENLDKDGNGFV
jgi:hypothetical protein